MSEMMKHLPSELQNSLNNLWAMANQKHETTTKRIYQKSKPLPTDRLTHSTTFKQRVMAMAVKALRLKVSEALKSPHSTE
jgi:hypothetical protein